MLSVPISEMSCSDGTPTKNRLVISNAYNLVARTNVEAKATLLPLANTVQTKITIWSNVKFSRGAEYFSSCLERCCFHAVDSSIALKWAYRKQPWLCIVCALCIVFVGRAHTHTHMHAYYNCRNQWTIDFILFVLVIFLSFRAVLSFEILSLFLISRFMLVFVRVRCSSWMFVPFNTDPSSDTICNSMDDEFVFVFILFDFVHSFFLLRIFRYAVCRFT